MYHSVDSTLDDSASFLHVTPRHFAKHMWCLRILGYSCVSLAEALRLHGEEHKRRFAAITFDDGYRDTLTNALPILLRYGFTATCFAVSGCLGGVNGWDVGKMGRKALMSVEDLNKWHSAGMEIGAHSRTHRRLVLLDDLSLREEIHGAKKELESTLQVPVTSFAYPFGCYDDRCREAVVAAGYSAAVTASMRRSKNCDVFALPRIGVFDGSLSILTRLFLSTSLPDSAFRILFPLRRTA